MGKDYAGRGRGGGRQASQKPVLPGWVWLLAGVAIGVAVAAGYYISRPAAPTSASSKPASTKQAEPKKVEIPPKEPSRFTFYELLPDFEVVIPKEVLKQKARAKAPGADAAPGEAYLVQVGSFKSRSDAEQQKANLALLGIEARIESVTIDDHDSWFRVRVGPEPSAAAVEEMLLRLDENNIDALVMRVKR